MLGLNASTVPNNTNFITVQICIQQQRETYGEYFWNRAWFLPNLSICLKRNVRFCLRIIFNSSIDIFSYRYYQIKLRDMPDPYFKEDFILGKIGCQSYCKLNLNHRQAMNNGLSFIWKLLMQRIVFRGNAGLP